MEITGCDLVVFTTTPPRDVFAHVLASVLSRWPNALVLDLDKGSGAIPLNAAGITASQLPAGSRALLFVRDAELARHVEDHAYVPMADGDGPFAVHARVRRGVVFEVARLNEVQVTDDEPHVVCAQAPYQAWICSPELFEITAVTPGDPDEQPFACWVLDEVKRACRGSA